jgi:hypothetical protein
MGGPEYPPRRELASSLSDSVVVLSMTLSVFSGVVVGVDGFVSDAGPAHFYFVA